MGFLFNVSAQTTTTYTVRYHTPGNFTFPIVTSSIAIIGTNAPNVYLVAGGGRGGRITSGSGETSTGGGGGGASAILTGYQITNYAIPFTVGSGAAYSSVPGTGGSTTFGNGEVTVTGGSNGGDKASPSPSYSYTSGGTGGAAISGVPKVVPSSYGSAVQIAASYKGGNGGATQSLNILSLGHGGSGGSGAGKSMAGNNATNASGGFNGGSAPGAAPDIFGGAGGGGGSDLDDSDGKTGSSGGGGGGGHTDYSTGHGHAGSGGNGRVWVEVSYRYTGASPATPLLNLTDQCYEKTVLSETLAITNPEADVQYSWYRSKTNSITASDILLKQGIGTEYQSYLVTTPGYYYVIARRLDNSLTLSNFSGATELSPMPFGSDKINSAIVKLGRLPRIDNLETTFACATGPITASAFTGIIPAGTVYTWTMSNPDNVQRTATSSTYNPFTSGDLLNLNEQDAIVTYTVIPSDTLNGVVCTGNSFTVQITVPPAELKLEVLSNVTLCPELGSDSITVNLNDFVTEQQGDLFFFRYSTGTDTIKTADAYRIYGSSNTVYAQASNAGGCKTDRMPIQLNVKYGVFANFAWDENNQFETLCLNGMDLTKLVTITKADDYYHNTVVEFYDNEVLIENPTNYDVTGPIKVKLKNNYSSSLCEYNETVTIVAVDPNIFTIPVSDQTVCPDIHSYTESYLYNLMSAFSYIHNGVYRFYSDETGNNLVATYNTHNDALPLVNLAFESTTDFWVGMSCSIEDDPITALFKFTVTINRLPLVEIVTNLFSCSGGYVNLTSIVNAIPDSRCGIKAYKEVNSSGNSNTFNASSATNCYLSAGYKYYVTVSDTLTGCDADILLPVGVLPDPLTQTITIREDALTVDLTKGIKDTALPSDWISYHDYDSGNYTVINDPKQVALPENPNFYVKVENTPCYSDYMPLTIRKFGNNNFSVRDSLFCTNSAYSQNMYIGQLIIADNLQPYYEYENGNYHYYTPDSLFVYDDAAGNNLIGKMYLYSVNSDGNYNWQGLEGSSSISFSSGEYTTKEVWVRLVGGQIATGLKKISVTHNQAPSVTFATGTIIEVPLYQNTNILDFVNSITGGYEANELYTVALVADTVGMNGNIANKPDMLLYAITGKSFDPADVYSIKISDLGSSDWQTNASMPEGDYATIMMNVTSGGTLDISGTLPTYIGGCNGTSVSNLPIIRVVAGCSNIEVPDTQPVEVCGYMTVGSFVTGFSPRTGSLSYALWNETGSVYEPVISDTIPNEIGTYKYEVTFTGTACPTITKEIEFNVTHLGVQIKAQNLIFCDPADVPTGAGVDLDVKTAVLSPALNPEDEDTVWRFYYYEGGVETAIPNGLIHISDVPLPAGFSITQTGYFEYTTADGCVYTEPFTVNIGTSAAPKTLSAVYFDTGVQETANVVIMPPAALGGISSTAPIVVIEARAGSEIDFSKTLAAQYQNATLVVRPVENELEAMDANDAFDKILIGDYSALVSGEPVTDPLAYTVPAHVIQFYLLSVINENGCESKAIFLYMTATGGLYTWSPSTQDAQGDDKTEDGCRDWNDPTNWNASKMFEFLSPSVPSANSKVLIGANHGTYYPDLTSTDDAVCKDIYFVHGAELIRPDKLTYERAYVALNFGLEDPSHPQSHDINALMVNSNDPAGQLNLLRLHSDYNPLSRNQWHLLTAPLGDMVTGDYSFGGYPATYLRKFSASASTTGTALVGNWSNYFTSTTTPLAPGEGFVLWLNSYQDKPLYREYGSGVDALFGTETREYGLAKSNGLLVFPYFDTKEWSDAHHIHAFDEATATSRFYGVNDKVADLPLLNNYGTKKRTEAAHRFIFEQAADAPNVTYPVTSGNVVWADDTHHFALIGNPYISSIDFDQFYADNSEAIKSGFYLFTGDQYETYSPEGSDLNRYIAPMQSFLVEMQSNVATAELTFNVENISLPREDGNVILYSPRQVSDRLKITLNNDMGSANTYLATRDYGTPTAGRYDLTKLLSGIKATPEVYTLKAMAQDETKRAAIANQIIPENNAVIPLGIATSTNGDMNFALSGMDAYNAQITFVDALLNVEEDITGQSGFSYDFTYSPLKDTRGNALANENRFFLRISNVPTGIDNLSDNRITIYDTTHDICIAASKANPIKSVLITDVQGRVLYRNNQVGAAYTQVRKTNELPSVCVVKVITERSAATQKLITK
ncbi:hypothetical protein FACS189463_0720 [Bacteroidia bacterium]|nr:hypothetical protein FACS189463_0720 [Bacteroidia bacterium]